jgi:hypothetical protein
MQSIQMQNTAKRSLPQYLHTTSELIAVFSWEEYNGPKYIMGLQNLRTKLDFFPTTTKRKWLAYEVEKEWVEVLRFL